MAGIVDIHGNDLFNEFDFESWSVERRLEFLEQNIELRIKYLSKQISPKRLYEQIDILRCFEIPIDCQERLDILKHKHDIDSDEFKEELSLIEFDFFGAIEFVVWKKS